MPDQILQQKWFKAKMLKLDVNPMVMKQFSKQMVSNTTTNILNEAPTEDKIYSFNGKQYGRPLFRLLSEDSEKKIPGQQGLRFSKDGKDNLHLNIIIEAYREESNVIPLDFREITINLVYDTNEAVMKLPLSITQTLPVDKANVLKHIYAHAIISPEKKEAIYEALVNTKQGSKLEVDAGLWWQKPEENPVKEQPKEQPKPAQTAELQDLCTTFDSSQLIVVSNRILLKKKKSGLMAVLGAKPFMNFKTDVDAKKALNVINHYKLNRRCVIGKNFSYFLSGNNPPTGALNGEDIIAFNPAKLEIKQINNFWKIVEGSHALFDFGIDKRSANHALNIIKKHGFDAVCYVGRPRPEMTYLKRTKPIRMQMIHRLNPQLIRTHVLHQSVSVNTKPSQPETPQKINIKTQIHLFFERKDPEVFQGFFDELESKEYKWEQGAKIDPQNPSVLHSYYYRLTNDPNKVFFLPQVYRIGINHETGAPKVNINLYNIEKETGETEYRINMTFQVTPYFHPRAKKDLMQELDIASDGKIKYVENLILSGYKGVSFELDKMFLQGNALFSSKYTEKLSEIDPAIGFTITADHSLESFEDFKQKLLSDGINIGKIYFDLEEEKDGITSINKSKPINVELNFKKLENIPLEIKASSVNNGQQSIISGFDLYNKTDIPVNVEGVELTLLSSIDNHVYDVDSELNTKIRIQDWPINIEANSTKTILLDDNDIDTLSNEHRIWNELVCEPHGIRANIEPEVIMASVIDYASGDPEVWNLEVVCPLYKNWDDWTDDQRLPYKGIVGLNVDVKINEGEVFSVELDRDTPEGIVKMSRSVKQLLQSTSYDNRKYQYRLTSITLPPSNPGEWIIPENTSVNRLRVFPEL